MSKFSAAEHEVFKKISVDPEINYYLILIEDSLREFLDKEMAADSYHLVKQTHHRINSLEEYRKIIRVIKWYVEESFSNEL